MINASLLSALNLVELEAAKIAIIESIMPEFYKQEEKEMIKFMTEKENKELTFGDVENDQFFVDYAGRLCQKVTSDNYNIIASSLGIPFADANHNVCFNQSVVRILPKVTKIEF